jgi:hypothetical protein
MAVRYAGQLSYARMRKSSAVGMLQRKYSGLRFDGEGQGAQLVVLRKFVYAKFCRAK